MLTNRLIDATFDSLRGNMRAALRISLVPILLAVAAIALLMLPLIRAAIEEGGGTVRVAGGGQIATIFVSALILFYAIFHAAVGWHRFSLGAEGRAGAGPRVVYGLISFLITLVILAAMLVPVLLIGTLAGTPIQISVGSYGEALARGWGHVALNFAATFAFAYFLMRWSPWLVSTALWEKSGRSFLRTWPIRKEIAHVALLYALATLAWSMLGFVALPWPLALAVDLSLGWFAFMLSVAVLTEIYRATA
jgi:hypothetical protein